MNTLYQFWSPSHSTLWVGYIYMRKLNNFNNKSIYWLKRMYYTHLSSFLFYRYEKWFTYYYSKYDTYGKEKNYKCIAKPRSKQNTAFVYICKKIIRTFKFFYFFIIFFFWERVDYLNSFFMYVTYIIILFCFFHI